jgi:hypothetical protein
MSDRRRCDCADDDEFVAYQPAFVQAYLDNRECAEQTIDEWTRFEGVNLFATSDIYRPISLSVAVSGTEPNAFEVDMARPDWFGQLEGAVRTTLTSAGLAKAGDKVSLENVRREPIHGLTRYQLEQTGTVYATLNGQRTVDLAQSKQAGLGCALRTPLTHSPIKEELLMSYVTDLFARAGELLIGELAGSADVMEVNKRVSSDGDDGVKKAVADLIMRDAGTGATAELKTFDRLVETYAEPLALEALKRGDLTLRSIAEQMATRIVEQVASQMQSHYKDVESFYQAQQLTKAPHQAKSERTIFATDSTMAQNAARIGTILRTYPTATKLHRTVIANALDKNERLAHEVISALKNSIPAKRRQRIASEYEKVGPRWRDEYGEWHEHGYGDRRRHRHREGTEGHHTHDGKGRHHGRRHGAHERGEELRAEIGATVPGELPPGHTNGRTQYQMQQEDDALFEEEVQEHGRDEAIRRRNARRRRLGVLREPVGTKMGAESDARVRSYVMAGLVPPEFEPDEPATVRSVQSKYGAEPIRSAFGEPPSLEPLQRAKMAEPPSLEPIPRPAKVGARAAEPPSLEPIPRAAKVGARTVSAEPPSLEPMPQSAKVATRTAPVPANAKVAAPAVSSPSTKVAEPPSLELVPRRVAARQTEPPSLEMFQRPRPVTAKTSPSQPPKEEEGLPSLDRLFRLAAVESK